MRVKSSILDLLIVAGGLGLGASAGFVASAHTALALGTSAEGAIFYAMVGGVVGGLIGGKKGHNVAKSANDDEAAKPAKNKPKFLSKWFAKLKERRLKKRHRKEAKKSFRVLNRLYKKVQKGENLENGMQTKMNMDDFIRGLEFILRGI